jgi:hypothetical protein
MKNHRIHYQPPMLGGLTDPRSVGTPQRQPRKVLLNDARSTR